MHLPVVDLHLTHVIHIICIVHALTSASVYADRQRYFNTSHEMTNKRIGNSMAVITSRSRIECIKSCLQMDLCSAVSFSEVEKVCMLHETECQNVLAMVDQDGFNVYTTSKYHDLQELLYHMILLKAYYQ